MRKEWRRTLKLWMPALVGIPAMLLLGYWFKPARFILFTHHLFWIAAIILLINPVIETLWPGATPDKQHARLPPQPSAKALERRKAHKLPASKQAETASETPAARLARLRKAKTVLDQDIEKLGSLDQRHRK